LIDGQEFSEWINEEIDELDGTGYDLVVQHLRESIEIVDIEIGYFQFIEMAPVFAYAVARWFAKIGNGWIQSNDNDWWKVDGYAFSEILPSET
jgi:hypothetical protein